jgi:hypothetical protein
MVRRRHKYFCEITPPREKLKTEDFPTIRTDSFAINVFNDVYLYGATGDAGSISPRQPLTSSWHQN